MMDVFLRFQAAFAKWGADVHRIALVEGCRTAPAAAVTVFDALVGAQHGLREAAALHLRQLVHQHVADGADLAR
jgi:hypothetical protein